MNVHPVNPGERWEQHQKFLEDAGDSNGGSEEEMARELRTFAMRGDGALMLWPQNESQPTEALIIRWEGDQIIAESEDGTIQSDIYCEPMWLAGWTDTFHEMFAPEPTLVTASTVPCRKKKCKGIPPHYIGSERCDFTILVRRK